MSVAPKMRNFPLNKQPFSFRINASCRTGEGDRVFCWKKSFNINKSNADKVKALQMESCFFAV